MALITVRELTKEYVRAKPVQGRFAAVRTLFTLCEDERLNHRVQVVEGVRADDCAELLRAFFRERRAEGKK